MMKSMGYKENTGLGRDGTGRLEPVLASSQKGRRGLGLKLEELDMAALKWDKSMEIPLHIPEIVEWYESASAEEDLQAYDGDLLWSWAKEGRKKLTIDDETNFCDPAVLSNILRSKTIFDKLGSADMVKARTRSNPFETIKHNIFQNRAAVKMANMDSMFDFMFTNPVDKNGNPLVREDELLYFADVCAGPGGFTEYILSRKGWGCKGFGFTLKSENDFKLHEFYAGSPETFDTYYGINEDGNVYDPENISSLKDYVLKQVADGVHVMMADGGFSVEGQENIQEILSKQLYLCQCLVALALVRVQGHFVVKLFDIFTPFSVGLIYLMSKCFDQICLCKPNTSRPANSERYLVCKWKRSGTEAIENYFMRVNEYMWENKYGQEDIMELVPMDMLLDDKPFFNYIFDHNNNFGQIQVQALLKIAAFTRDSDLIDDRQGEVKRKCLEMWKLEDKMRKAPPKITNYTYFSELLGIWEQDKQFMDQQAHPLELPQLKKIFLSIFDWYLVPIESEQNSIKHLRTFFMSKGGRNVCYYNQNTRSWSQINDLCIELAPKTLLYGEIVKEYIGEHRKQRHISALHIIDAIVLGGTDIRKLPLPDRLRKCAKFARAHNKPLKTIQGMDGIPRVTVPIRAKRVYTLQEFARFADSLQTFHLKNGSEKLGVKLQKEGCDIEDRYYIPEGVMFLNGTNEAFTKCWSKTAQNFYYYDRRANKSIPMGHEIAQIATASFKNSFRNRVIWRWDDEQTNLREDTQIQGNGRYVHRQHIESLLNPNPQR